MNTPRNYTDAYEASRRGNSKEQAKGLGVLSIAFLLLMLISMLASCGKAELPTPKGSMEKTAFVTPEPASQLTLGSDTVKARFWIANDSAYCRVRQLLVGPNTASAATAFTTAAVVVNGDYLVYSGTGEMIDVTTTVGQTVRTMHLLIEKLGGDTIRITSNDLLQIDAPNAQAINANVFLVSTLQAESFRVIALPPILGQAVNGPTFNQ